MDTGEVLLNANRNLRFLFQKLSYWPTTHFHMIFFRFFLATRQMALSFLEKHEDRVAQFSKVLVSSQESTVEKAIMVLLLTIISRILLLC